MRKKQNTKAATTTADGREKGKSTVTGRKEKSAKKATTTTVTDENMENEVPSKSGAASKVKKVNAKSGKPATEGTEMTKLEKGASTMYWAYKAFQAAQLCCGDVTVIAELASELLDEGMAETMSNPALVGDAVEAVFSLHGGVKKFRKSTTNFSDFSTELSNQFKLQGEPVHCAKKAGASVGRTRGLGKECPTGE